MSNYEFSRKKIRNAVLQESIQSPVTTYPVVIGTLGLLGLALWGPGLLTIGAVATGFALGGASFVNEFFRRGQTHSLAYLEKIRHKMRLERQQKLVTLRRELDDIGAHDAVVQLELFSKKFDNFVAILKRKFSESELTYSRYLSIAEQVYLAGIDNLEDAYLALKSVSAVDIGYIEEKLATADGESAEALQERMTLYKQQSDEVDAILVENEQALTQLDNVSTRLALVQTQKGHADVDMDLAMEELSRMANRAMHYSN